MDKYNIDFNQLIAALAGAITGTDWKKVRTVMQGVITVFTGTVSAVYLTPLVAAQIGWTKPVEMLGLSFLLGTLGLRTVQASQVSEKVKTEKYGFEKNKLFPTDIGSLVTDFLTENFQEILNYGFTAAVEKEFDEIAQGKKGRQEMLEGFYQPFHSTVENALVNSQRVTGERILGTDPASGRQLSVRMGNYGPFAQIGTKEDGGELRYG